jgi:hypothetical protein
MNGIEAILAIGRPILKDGRLLYVGDGVDAESAHAFIGPKVCHVKEGLAHLGILPV